MTSMPSRSYGQSWKVPASPTARQHAHDNLTLTRWQFVACEGARKDSAAARSMAWQLNKGLSINDLVVVKVQGKHNIQAC